MLDRAVARLRRAFLVAGSPVDLAVCRIVLFSYLLQFSLSRTPERMAGLPEALREVPVGSGLLFDVLPPDAALARGGAAVMAVAAAMAAVGFRTRAAASVWVVVALWVHGIEQLFGKVDHDHHLLWLALLLAASPCADVLSIDSITSRRRPTGSLPQVRYGFPIRIWWLLIGLVYFFPGFWKLASGLSWAGPDNMRSLLWVQWIAQDDFVPLLRLDEWPAALVAMGVATIIFELSFVFAIFTRWRVVAVVAGAFFHLSTHLMLGITFYGLVLTYVAFVPWSRMVSAADPVPRDVDRVGVPTRSSSVAALVLVLAVAVFGATEEVDGWPVAAYPTFSGRPAPVHTEVEFAVVRADGRVDATTADLVFAWVPASRRDVLISQFGRLDPSERIAVLADVADRLDLGPGAERIKVTAVTFSADPDNPERLDSKLLYEVDLAEL